MNATSEKRAAFLKEIGVGPLWIRRNIAPDLIRVEATPSASHVSSAWEQETTTSGEGADARGTDVPNRAPDALEMNWDQLKSAVAACKKCGLCAQRTHTVFGVGDEKAKWLFVGEGPGRNEDLQGEPFVGKAGLLLDNMLAAVGLRRGANAYIANIVKCRPTDGNGKDRPPTAEEANACMPYLKRQIELIRPDVIVALGKTAALSLLQREPETSVSTLRGSVHRYEEIPLVVTYHPAYLLRTPADKHKAWADLCLAKKISM